MKRSIIIFLIIMVTIIAFAAYRSKQAKDLSIGLGFMAKEFCSCHFVIGNDRAFCEDYVDLESFREFLKWDSLMPTISIDEHEVSARVLWIKRRAVYQGPRFGCRIL